MSERKLFKRGFVARWALALGLLVALPSFADTGPIGWWKLDEGTGTSAADSSGNADTGTLTNSPSWISGRIGSGALSFAGNSAYVTAPNNGKFTGLYQTGGVTITAWINPAGAGTGHGRIVDFDSNGGGWFLAMSTASSLWFVADEFATTQASRVSSTGIALNTWQHVAVTWDGSTSGGNIHFYINGASADSTTIVNGVGAEGPDGGSPVGIGNAPTGAAHGFSGGIDEVRIYNRVLSAAEIQALADSTAPSTPTGMTASAVSGTQVNVSWTASTDNVAVTGYLLDRCQGSGCSTFTQIASPTTTSYSDTGLTASTSYSYRVRATDANSNLSPYSTTASVTTSGSGDTTPPSAPANLSATAIFITQVNLSWSASTDNVGVTGYLLERCQGDSCTSFAQIATPGGTTYNDVGLTSNTSYTYRVRAKDAANNLSPYSNTLTAITLFDSGTCTPP